MAIDDADIDREAFLAFRSEFAASFSLDDPSTFNEAIAASQANLANFQEQLRQVEESRNELSSEWNSLKRRQAEIHATAEDLRGRHAELCQRLSSISGGFPDPDDCSALVGAWCLESALCVADSCLTGADIQNSAMICSKFGFENLGKIISGLLRERERQISGDLGPRLESFLRSFVVKPQKELTNMFVDPNDEVKEFWKLIDALKEAGCDWVGTFSEFTVRIFSERIQFHCHEVWASAER